MLTASETTDPHLDLEGERSDRGEMIGPEGTGTVFPTTASQRWWWRLDAERPGDPTLNISARWRLAGTIDAALLGRAIDALVARHEILRTGFALRDGVPSQVVAAAGAPFRVREVNAGAADGEETLRIARDEARTPFDLARAPLLRATLVRFASGGADLLVTTHHIAGDCWSNGILAAELVGNYDALASGRPIPDRPDLELQFADYARWQAEWFRQGGDCVPLAWWTRHLAAPPATLVPIDRLPPACPGLDGAISGRALPPELAAAAGRIARERGATFFTVGVAALAILLARWTGETDIAFATQVAGRDAVELEGVIGPFVNTVVIRLDLGDGPDGASPDGGTIIDRAMIAVGDAIEHAAAPIGAVLDAMPAPSQPDRRHPATAVNFLVQRAFTRDAGPDATLSLSGVPNVSPGSAYDLNLFLVERPSGWRIACEYDPELFDDARVAWLIDTYLRILRILAADLTLPIDAIRLDGVDHAPRRRPETSTGGPSTGGAPTGQPAAGAPAFPPEAVTVTPGGPSVDPALAALWSRVLGRDAVGDDVHFFEAGGDSVRAARLIALTREQLGRTIRIGDLFRAPTLRAMTALLGAEADAPSALPLLDRAIVPVQPLGDGVPLFAINNTGIFHTLSRHLGTGRPLFAVQALDPDISPSLHPTDPDAVARRYVDAIRRVRPHGPYALLGLCAAGKVAYAVACRLRAEGEEVPLVAVVDSWAPGHWLRLAGSRRLLGRANLRASRLSRQIGRVAAGTLTMRGFVANRAWVRRSRNALFERMRRAGLLDHVPPGAQNNLFVDYLDAVSRAIPPVRFDGTILVFHGPEQPRGPFLDPSYGWSEIAAGPLAVVPVPADTGLRFEDHHHGLFQDPGARVIADRIAAALS